MSDDDKALVEALREISGAFGGIHPASITQRQAADRIEAQAAEIEFHKERADALALQADEWEGKYLIGIAEIERLRSVIDATALHWLALQDKHPIQWEGAIDAAMAAACAEIEKLRRDHASVVKEANIAKARLKGVEKQWHADRAALAGKAEQ